MRALLITLGLALCFAANGQSRPLFVVPTEGTSSATKDGALRVALYARDLVQLARVLGTTPPAASAERLEYAFGEYPQLSSPAARSWLESTFVVDFAEPDAAKLHAELTQAASAKPDRPDIVEFAAGAIKGSLDRSFDPASVAARNRRGDCSEYAVVVAALARATGLPARVVVGVALISKDGRHEAYGHAWAEVQEGGRWVVADSALHSVGADVEYLPFGVLTDEGPGYILELARMSQVWIERIVVL